jgi:hypothetical protein
VFFGPGPFCLSVSWSPQGKQLLPGYFILFFFFFFGVPGFIENIKAQQKDFGGGVLGPELRAFTLCHSTSPFCDEYF